jgi:hypothetical protein
LEDSPDLHDLDPQAIAAHLRSALAILPIDALLIGWNVPAALFRACATVTEQAGVPLYRWHPLLTSDGTLEPRQEWMTISALGEPVPGFQNMPEFTFVCPNRPAARDAMLKRLHAVLHDGPYQGVFLDRIRFPSPAADPVGALACFCPDCHRVAAHEGLDLESARQRVLALAHDPLLVQALLAGGDPMLEPLLAFRRRTITRFVGEAAAIARGAGCAVGLDGFSPAIAPLVGQDLGALARCGDWTKIMSYGHTYGPAGLPFELLGLAEWLIAQCGIAPTSALHMLTRASGLALPQTRADLRATGVAPHALASEVQRAHARGVEPLLFGIELVDIPGVAELEAQQIRADLRAIRAAQPHGVAISWDLRFIALERLKLLREEWLS